jgi:CheY-like chemotaxis protein
MKVMIVDDEPDIRESLQEFFEDEGYVVSTAENGAQALALLNDESLPCVVILDLMMPIVGGGEVYARMQQDPRLARVPVVVSTSDPSKAPSGVLIMRKPIDLNRLLGTVRHHCPH